MAETNPKAAKQLASKILKNRPSDNQVLSQSTGKPLRFSLGSAPSISKPTVSVDDLVKFQLDTKDSEGDTRKLATFLNQKFGFGTVEKGLNGQKGTNFVRIILMLVVDFTQL